LGAPKSALVIMDAGIATEANVAWLIEQGYRYLVVNRGGTRQFDESKAISIETASGDTLEIQKEVSADNKEVLLYCHSPGREEKERSMLERFCKGFEDGLQKIADGLSKPGTGKRMDKLQERIGRLRQKSHGAGRHYKVNLVADESGKKAKGLTWEKIPVKGTMATHPGVYCLRSSEVDWDEAKLWRTYTMLTDLESVFRSMKSELGIRPIFHSKENRVDGHLFITVLAYQAVQFIRKKLKDAGINQSWAGLREVMSVQQRVTASLKMRDGRTAHIRKSTEAEPALKEIYKALGIKSAPGRIQKRIT
jgi:transposase